MVLKKDDDVIDDDVKDDDVMDIEWIEEYETEDNSYKMFYPEPVTKIKVSILYVNKKTELEKIREEFIYLSVPNLLKKEDLIRLIKSYDIHDAIKYKLVSILVYNIDIQHNEVKKYLNGHQQYDFITNLRNIEDYELKSSLAYFQEINNIYIIFNEEDKKDIKEIPSTIKKIHTDNSNSNSNSNTKHKNTKRVKFNLPHKKTKRRKYI